MAGAVHRRLGGQRTTACVTALSLAGVLGVPRGARADAPVLPPPPPAPPPALAPPPPAGPMAPAPAREYVPPGAPPEPPTVLVTERVANRALLLTGSITLYIGYGVGGGTGLIYLSLVYPVQAATTDDDTPSPTATWLILPIAGPLFAAQTDFADENPDLKPWLYVDAGVQAAGVLLMLASLAFKENYTYRKRAPGPLAGDWQLGPGPAGSHGVSVGFALD